MSIWGLGEKLKSEIDINKVEKKDVRLKGVVLGWSYLIFFVVVLIKSERACS